MDPSSSAHGADAARSAERRANELYWLSEHSVNRIAEDLDLSKSALYGIIRPLGTGSGCPRCASEVVFLNRTAKQREEVTCPACAWEGSADDAADGLGGDGREGARSRAAGMGPAHPAHDEGRSWREPGPRGHDGLGAADPVADRPAAPLPDARDPSTPGRRLRPTAEPRARPPLRGRGPAPHGDALQVDERPPAARLERTDGDGEQIDVDLPAPPGRRAFGWSTRRTLAGGALLGAAAGLALVLWARRR